MSFDSASDPDLKNETLVCFCHSVPVREIVRAIQGGACTLAQIQSETQASTGCGGCACEVEELLARKRGKP